MLSTTPKLGQKILYKFSSGRKKYPATVEEIDGNSVVFTLDGAFYDPTATCVLITSKLLFDYTDSK
jgi:hypothetical protein